MKFKEIPVCGLAAVEALYSKTPDAIKRLFFDSATSRKVAKISSHLARTKRIYRMVDGPELAKIAGTLHHGGIVAIVEARPLRPPTPEEVRAWARGRAPLLLFDRIGNAHNLGAIVRTAAFLGVERAVIPHHPQQALPGEAAHRVAEGGMEYVEIFQVADLAGFCLSISPFFEVVGASVGKDSFPLDRWVTRQKPADKPVALVLGNEEHGISSSVASACTALVKIPGSGRMDSLNVSAAAAILMWALFRPGEGTAQPLISQPLTRVGLPPA